MGAEDDPEAALERELLEIDARLGAHVDKLCAAPAPKADVEVGLKPSPVSKRKEAQNRRKEAASGKRTEPDPPNSKNEEKPRPKARAKPACKPAPVVWTLELVEAVQAFQYQLKAKCGSSEEAVRILDIHGSGVLKIGELQTELKRLRLSVPPATLRKIARASDMASSGEINVRDLLRPPGDAVDAHAVPDKASRAPPRTADGCASELILRFRTVLWDRFGGDRKAMNEIDISRTCNVTFNELDSALKRLQIPFPYKDLKIMYKALDTKKKGGLNFHELFHLTPGDQVQKGPLPLEADFARAVASVQLPCTVLKFPSLSTDFMAAEFKDLLRHVIATAP